MQRKKPFGLQPKGFSFPLLLLPLQKFNEMMMTTIVINIKDKAKAKHIRDAVKLLKGVSQAEVASDEFMENISMLKACKAARNTSFVAESDILEALK